jgi:hypothetical protein
MNYQEAAIIRKKSFAELMTQKLMEGEGVLSSFKGTRQQRSQARKLARKEKFDILNIANFLTRGNTTLTSLVGKALGRSSEDIDYFTGKKLQKLLSADSSQVNKKLIEILDFMKMSNEKKEKNYQTEMMYQEMNELQKKDRHQEVLNVFLNATKKTEQKRRRVRSFSTPMSGGFATTALVVAGVAGLLLMSKDSIASIKKKSEDDFKIIDDTSEKEISSLSGQYDEIFFISEQDKISSEYEKELGIISEDESNWNEFEKIDFGGPKEGDEDEDTLTKEPRASLYSRIPEPGQTVGPEPTEEEAQEKFRKAVQDAIAPRSSVSPVPTMPTQDTAQKISPADISIRGETGARTPQEAKSKSSQIVKNDPKPGEKSYGVFGMNTLSKSIHQFVRQNPQFNFKSEPGTDQFDKEWKEVAEKKSDELFQAQMRWYSTNVLEPLRSEIKTLLPPTISSDESVLALMADRRIQYGRVMEKDALAHASSAKTAQEFIDAVTYFDKINIGKAFKTYLASNPGNEFGLLNRIKLRRNLALQVSSNNIGQAIQESTVQNSDIKKELLASSGGNTTIINETQNIVNQTMSQIAYRPGNNSTHPIFK